MHVDNQCIKVVLLWSCTVLKIHVIKIQVLTAVQKIHGALENVICILTVFVTWDSQHFNVYQIELHNFINIIVLSALLIYH